MIENIQNYNVLYNTLFDLDGGGIDQQSKRFLENIDPSVSYPVSDAATGASASVMNSLLATASDASKPLMINNWLGFLSSASTPVIDTNDCSDIILEIRLAPASVLWAGGAAATIAGPNYSLSNIRFTISEIVCNSPDYYNFKAAKLLGDGLVIGYQTFVTNEGSQVAKAYSLSYTVNINATSLDQVIATMLDADYLTVTHLQLGGAGVDSTSSQSFNAAYVTPVDDAVGVATSGDLFNNYVYFKRDGLGLTGSSFEINNVMMNPYPLPAEEVYNETLIALGNLNIDMASGINPGCVSLAHYLKYYFTHILSLENIASGDFYKSGLDGRAASMSINWKTSFSTTPNCTPIIYCKTTLLLQINEAHQISVIV